MAMQPSPSTKPAAWAQSVSEGSGNGSLCGALQGRLGVQAAQEDLQRQRGSLEVLAQQLEIGAFLGGAGDRQLGGTERFGHEGAQSLSRAPRKGILGPTLPNLDRQPQEPVADRIRHAAFTRLPAQTRERLR